MKLGTWLSAGVLVVGIAACGDSGGDSTSGSGGGSTSGSGGGSTSGSGGGSTTSTSGSGGGGSIDCEGACQKATDKMCMNTNPDCVTNCQNVYVQVAPCANEFAAYIDCSAALPLTDWVCDGNGDPSPLPACADEDAAFQACVDAL